MNVDLRPLQRAIRALSFTLPLEADDPRYVDRSDGLRDSLLQRVREAGHPRVLLAGPAGCGKSTELIRADEPARDDFLVVLCRCDRDLDLFTADRTTVLRYVLWRLLFECTETGLKELLTLSPQVTHDALGAIGAPTTRLPGTPRLFFGRGPRGDAPEREAAVAQTFVRLVEEATTKLLPVLLLVDGLEKVPPTSFGRVVASFIRSPELDACRSIVVTPLWALQGRERVGAFGDVDVVEARVTATTMIPGAPGLPERRDAFVQRVVHHRLIRELFLTQPGAAPDWYVDGISPLLPEIGRLSGGIVRDGLELVTGMCRAALAAGTPSVGREQLHLAAREMVRTYGRIFSDDPARAWGFLDHVRKTGQLAGDPEWRDPLLGCGAVLPTDDDAYCVHPLLTDESLR
jgi:hypothetical protein